MIVIDGHSYPSEERDGAAPPPQPDQELPAGAANEPFTLANSQQKVNAEGWADARAAWPEGGPGFPSSNATGVTTVGLDGPVVGQASPVNLPNAQRTRGWADSNVQNGPLDELPVDSAYPSPDGVADPGAGETVGNVNVRTVPETSPVTGDETAAARAMIEEASGIGGPPTVLKFVRYPTERRIMMMYEPFDQPGEARGLQRKY